MGPDEQGKDDLKQSLERLIREGRVKTVFQPIKDLRSGDPFGYQVLSRGEFPFNRPDRMFDVARRGGMVGDLDRACIGAALRVMASLPAGDRHLTFFVEAGARGFAQLPTLYGMKGLRLADLQIVIEVIGGLGAASNPGLQPQIWRHARPGYRVAPEILANGTAVLAAPATATPQFLKLSRDLVSFVDRDHERQKMVHEVTALASSAGIEVVGAAIERPEELKALADLGVRYGQGFLLGRPKRLGNAGPVG